MPVASPTVAMATNNTDHSYRVSKQSGPVKHQVEFYASLSRLADQIRAGLHPSIKLLSNTSADIAANNYVPYGTIHTPVTAPSEDVILRTAEARRTFPLTSRRNSPQNVHDAEISTPSRAKRRHIEEILFSHVERKKAQVRERDLLEEPQLVDPQRIFEQARKFVLPLSGFPAAPVRNHEVSSADNKSDNSSQANIRSSEEGEVRVESNKSTANIAETDQNQSYASSYDVHLNLTGTGQDYNETQSERQFSQRPLDDGSNPWNMPLIRTCEHDDTSIENHKRDMGNFTILESHVSEHRDESYSPPAADAFHSNFCSSPAPTSKFAADHDAESGLVRLCRNKMAVYTNSPSEEVQIGSVLTAASSTLKASHTYDTQRDSGIASETSWIQDKSGSTEHVAPRSKGQETQYPAQSLELEPLSDTLAESSSVALVHKKNRKRGWEHGPTEGAQESFREKATRLPSQPLQTPRIKMEPLSPSSLPMAPPRRLILRNDGNADVEVVAAHPNIGTGPTHLRTQSHEQSFHETPPYLVHRRPTRRLVSDQYYHPIDISESRLAAPLDERRIYSPLPISERYLASSYRDPFDPPSLYRQSEHIKPSQQATHEYYWNDASHIDIIRPGSSMLHSRQQSIVPPAAYTAAESYQVIDRPPPRILNHGGYPEVLQDRGEQFNFQPRARPLPRRIVRDQYGNEYIALPTATRRHHYAIVPEEPQLVRRAMSYHPASESRGDHFSPSVEENHPYEIVEH